MLWYVCVNGWVGPLGVGITDIISGYGNLSLLNTFK